MPCKSGGSKNPWVTLNPADRGRSGANIFPDMDWMVDYTGVRAKFCACPLSPSWRDYITEVYRLYASINPEILWLEDDFRNFNHQPVEFGCFCPLHLEAFSKRAGRKVSREKLVQNILAPGKPHLDRKIWFNLLRDVMIEVAGLIEKVVHDVSPDTQLGLMCSDPYYHGIEGRDWQRLLKALSGHHHPIVRPAMGCYQETSHESIYSSAGVLRRTISCLPEGTRICPELENFTYSLFSKSVRFTKLQLSLVQVCQANDITVNLYDHIGTPLEANSGYGDMLRQSKPFLNTLASRYLPGGREQGVGLIYHPKASYYVHAKAGENFRGLFPYDDGWSVPLQACGVPVTFASSNVVAVTGQVLRVLNQSEIHKLLSKGILLDLSALEVLIDMGYGEYLGVTIEEKLNKNDIPLSAEMILDPGFSAFKNAPFMTLTHLASSENLARLSLLNGAVEASIFVDPDRHRVMPGMVLFENSSGGRVAIYPFDLQHGTSRSFLNWNRKAQLSGVMKWLGRENLPLFVEGGAQMLPMRTDYENYTMVTVVNLTSDKWEDLSLTLSKRKLPFSEIEIVLQDGKWIDVPIEKKTYRKGHLKVTLPVQLEPLELTAICFNLSKRQKR